MEVSLETVREWYFLSGQIAKTFTELRSSLQQHIITAMGKDTELDAGDGWKFVMQERLTTQYDPAVLAKIFDEDTMALVMVPDKKKVTEMQKTMKLPAEQIHEMEKGLMVLGKTFALSLKPPKK